MGANYGIFAVMKLVTGGGLAAFGFGRVNFVGDTVKAYGLGASFVSAPES